MSFGIINDLSSKYLKIKEIYKKNKNDMLSSFESSMKDLISDKGKDSLLNNNQYELSIWHLPPKYIEMYDQTNDLFKECEIYFNKLQEEQQKKIMPSFDENENKLIDNNIEKITYNLNMKIKDINNLIKKIKDYYDNKLNYHEIQIKNNIVQNLLNKISDFTQNLKNNQEIYLKKFQELNSSELKNKDNNDILIEDNNNNNINSNTNQFFNQKQIKKNTLIKERNKELNSLLKNFYEITDIFKDAQKLVVEQGTILDRIDYNIDNLQININKAKEELIKNEKSTRSKCAKNVNLTLIIINFVLGFLIILKFK